MPHTGTGWRGSRMTVRRGRGDWMITTKRPWDAPILHDARSSDATDLLPSVTAS